MHVERIPAIFGDKAVDQRQMRTGMNQGAGKVRADEP